MNSLDYQRGWQQRGVLSATQTTKPFMDNPLSVGFKDDLVLSSVVPPVTVALEGRSICHRISLHKHASYSSLAKALHQMFVDSGDETSGEVLDLSNAIPGHVIAYEDIENDLLLAGDLNWKYVSVSLYLLLFLWRSFSFLFF